MPRRRSEQPNQPAQQPPNVPPTSTGAVSLTTPATSTTATNDPAKAIAAATCNVKSGGLTSQGVIHAAQLAAQSAGALLPVGFSYAHPVPAAVPTKPSEHKQSAGCHKLARNADAIVCTPLSIIEPQPSSSRTLMSKKS
ncbi:hypothetical protein F511_27504 [Dorcoceras hygrometricum]|uniref:Uncharacterized protein n=1 Tax=Dorcoceras hygrometricum TaxID=472368 RepID=A0A2Z7D2D9_9LAMI|nr:hypothetical protein F511_27504 [Dorcoceras hygrometricum]